MSTSTTAFVGYARRGPMDKAVRVQSWGEYERTFGGLDALSEMSYAVSQFFLNGGSEAWVVRVARRSDQQEASPISAAVAIADRPGGTVVFGVVAVDPGTWGNNIRVEIDYATSKPGLFNLTVSEVGVVEGATVAVQTETYRNLNLARGDRHYAPAVVNESSKLVRLVENPNAPSSSLPAATGTVGQPRTAAELDELEPDTPLTLKVNGREPAVTVKLDSVPDASLPLAKRAAGIASALQTSIVKAASETKAKELQKVSVNTIAYEDRISFVIRAAGEASRALVATGPLAESLGIAGQDRANVQVYSAAGASVGAQLGAAEDGSARAGADGQRPDALSILGSRDKKTGLYALENVDLFSLLCIPETMDMTDEEASAVASAAAAYCGERRAFYVLDPPMATKKDEPTEIMSWLDGNGSLRHKNVAVYWPRPLIPDPRNDFRLRTVAASGTVAGVYARTDTERGVWKAPAGTGATLRGVSKLEYVTTDGENGVLNPLAINCLRTLPVYGNVAWGGRTLVGSDQQASEWKYIPVRRTALMIEESLYRGLKWAVFEPNDEPLWSAIRLNVGSFMHRLFRAGAFQGQSPNEAYFVRCDAETTTQDDIDRGVVNIMVGFAPLKPAEFVVLRLSQIAGQEA